MRNWWRPHARRSPRRSAANATDPRAATWPRHERANERPRPRGDRGRRGQRRLAVDVLGPADLVHVGEGEARVDRARDDRAGRLTLRAAIAGVAVELRRDLVAAAV